MGVTTEVWRSRIGSFLPIIRSLSNCERRNWPSRKLYRTYNRPPEPSRTHHLSLNILLTLLSLTLALIVSRTHPFDHVRKLEFHQVMLDVLAVHFAVFHNHRTKRHSAGTWQECINITAAIRMVMFVLLLLCGDIESNPGPNEHQPMDTRQKKAHKIERMDTNEKIGISSSTLDRLWSEVCSRWDDVTIDDFKLTEADGTELVDEFYYQQLASKIPLQLRLKTKGTRSRSKSYARVNARPLTDDVIHEIATNHTTHDIVNFGLAMGLTQQRISKYKAENATEPRAESRGTENMIMNWRQRCDDVDQVGAFCNVLQQAELNELADDLSNGMIYSSHRVRNNIDVTDLQRQLRKYYVDVLCFVRTIPWKQESDVPINDGFNPPSLYHHKKTSKRNIPRFDPNFSCGKTTFFNDFHFNDGNVSQREHVEYLTRSYNDIFTIQQNNGPPGRILINGHAGVGKTTLLYKLAHDWAISTEESELKSVKLLIHLSLKGVSKDAMLGDEVIRQLLPKDTNYTGEQIENCLRQNSDDVVILLDGFDESAFAFQDPEDRVSYGSLYASIKYEEFRFCRIVVTSRPSKVEEFRGKLFNPYAEITINGFVRISIDEFIDNYCNERDAGKVKQIITSNLLNLQPLLRVPLFLAMICETVSNDLITDLPFTRTNLMKELCAYLFKTCNAKYGESENKVAQNMRDTSLEDCLATLGKLAGKQYVIDLKSQDVTSRDNEILEICIKAGFISTRERTSIQEKENCLYFFHGLLRDLCVAQYLVSSRASRLTHAQSHSLLDIHDVQISDSVFIFECGLLAGKRCMQTVFNFSSWSGYDIENCTTDFLIQCYFECQSAGYMEINTDIFNKNRTLFMDLNVLNDFAAVKHFLSHNPQSPTSYYFTQFVIKGEEYGIVQEEMNAQDRERDCLFRNLDIEIINELMTSCSYLTSITLLNCALSLVGYVGQTNSQFKSIQLMSVSACRGKHLLTALLYYIAKQFPNLQSLILTRVFDVDAGESDQTLNLCNMVSMLFDIGPTCSELKLAGMNGEDLDELQCDVNTSLQEFTIFDSVNVMNTSKLLSSLALHFPSLFSLTLSRSQLHFNDLDTEQKLVQHSATSNMRLIIKECKTSILLSKLLMITSIHFPYLNLLRIADSSVDFTNMTKKIDLKNLKYVYFKHCLQHVDLSNVIPAFRISLSRLPHLAFIDCSLKFSLDIMNERQEDVFPDIALTNCRIPYQCLSWVSTWCQRLTLHVNDNLYVEILYEQVWSKLMLIAHLHSKFRININDAANFPGWFPDLHALYFYNSLQPLPLEAFLGVEYPSVQVVLFRECKEEVHMSDAVYILNTCCPRLEKMFIRHCDVSFCSVPPSVQSDIRQIEFDACRNITFSVVMAFITSCCPFAVELTIGNCELANNESPLVIRMTEPEHNISFSIHPGVSRLSVSGSSTEPEDCSGIPITRHEVSKLRFLERVYFTNCSTSLNVTDIITVTNYNVKSLVASIILTKCQIRFTSEVAISNSPILNVITLDDCKLPSRSIFWVAKLCRMVHMYVNDNLMIEIFENTLLGKKMKVIHMHSKEAIDMGNVPHLPIILPDLDVIVFLNVLVDGSTDAWKGLKYASVRSVNFMDCKDVINIQQSFAAVSLYCQNIERFVVVNGYVSFAQKEERCLPLKELIFDRLMRVKFSDIIDFITTQCPILVDLKLQECKFDDEEEFEEHFPRAASNKLKAIGFYDFINTPVNVSNVMSVVRSRFQEAVTLSFITCKLSCTLDNNPSSIQWFDSILFKDCSFPAKSLVCIKSGCKRVNIHVADVFIELSDATRMSGKLNAKLKSDQPINIHDAPGLPFDIYDDHICELDFYNVMDCRQHNPEGTMHYIAVGVVHFFECQHTLNIANTLSVLSKCCPNLRELIVSETEVSLAGGRDGSHGNVKNVCIRNCNHIDCKDIFLFLTSCCPSVEKLSVTASEISFHTSSPQTPSVANSSIEEMYFFDCKVPEDFMQLVIDGYPEFEVSFFPTKNEGNSETAEWSITRKHPNTSTSS